MLHPGGGPARSTGTRVEAVCEAVSDDPMTNGMIEDSVDDNNPNLRSSRRWYGLRYESRLYYLSEVYTEVVGGSVASFDACP